MNKEEEIVTIKVYKSSREKLRVIAALKNEQHVDTVERLLAKEEKRLLSQKAKK